MQQADGTRTNIADISALVGRRFVSQSHNVCRIQKLADGAIRAAWRRNETEQDRREFEVWVRSILASLMGVPAGQFDLTTVNTDAGDVEAAALAEWQKKNRR